MKSTADDLRSFSLFVVKYFRAKIVKLAHRFEGFKNFIVDLLMLRRGVMQKRFWHSSMIGLSAFGVITSGAFGTQTIVSSTFPGTNQSDPRFAQAIESSGEDTATVESFYDTHTEISKKRRSKIEEHKVESGETLSEIATKYEIDVDTIKWANDITNVNTVKPGDTLKILPISGVAHTVVKGDTLESVAKKYSAEQQAILSWPYNDIGDDLKLKVGQMLIVPDGVPPKAPLTSPRPGREVQYIAQGVTSPAPGGGGFSWPTSGGITQRFAWYHPGIDIADRGAPPVAAADGGVVVTAGWPDNWGYGNRVVIDHGNGYKTLYAHLANIYVSVGQRVSRGQVIGKMGSTGRSTGIHTHFEIHYKGIAVNPLSILK